ncbi:type II toxin-antitoxin system RelE/ParE family toxin [Dermabacter vaginalis]|uniref:type II toxin-antitoxin system RelE/ParE family toxin n=1 Tax=Dermabacter vaginalis TaxID=1630135 RepID=UPI0027DEBDC1|nr:type II toxin-antitoxin system RelE/ParE family toxin [Dermabacter vaginalis]
MRRHGHACLNSVDSRVQNATTRKLTQTRTVRFVDSRCIPPGNRLEPLNEDRVGQHSIRVNAQWRLCFVWRDGGADDVELVDDR